MKRTLFLVVAVAVMVPCIALADTVWVVTESHVAAGKEAPANEVKTSKAEYAFRPEAPEMKVAVAGLVCHLRTSAAGSVPMGCNYTLTVDVNGKISGELRAGNRVCTQTDQIAASCKKM